jgi:alpha-tubulin suppressor-like RCC1 family protein
MYLNLLIKNGQLGLGDTENKKIPVTINITNIVKILKSGYYHCLLLNSFGDVYSFGSNNVKFI